MARRILGLVVVALSLLTLGAAPARHQHTYYVALGDSLAAGYQPDPAIGRDRGYVPRIHAALGRRVALRNFACDGATTASLLSGGGCAYSGGAASQLAVAERFLRRHPVSLVTIDIGGNDVNRCVRDTAIDQPCVLAALGTTAANLGEIVRRLRAAAPKARIVGMTYYNPYLASWRAGPAGQAVARQSLELTLLLNGILTGVYRAADVRVADVAGAFATTDLTTVVPLPGGGEAPLAVARICAWTWMCSRTDIHATSAGYQVIAEAFLAAAR